MAAARKQASAIVSVFEVAGEERKFYWTCRLSNRAAPVRVMVSNDDERIVTTDNWHNAGYGDDFMAFYNRTGQLEQYTLEEAFSEIFGPKESKLELRIKSWMNGLFQQDAFKPMVQFYKEHIERKRPRSSEFFSHSISSRQWRSHGIDFFESIDGVLYWGIWLDWAQRWFVWNTLDGTKTRLNPKMLQWWNKKGLQWARKQFRTEDEDGDPVTACRFLASVHEPQDRLLLIQALESQKENANWDAELRANADRALAILDDVETDFRSLGYLFTRRTHRYYFLGNLDLKILFPENPKDGQLYVYLLPDTATEDNWRDAIPIHRTGRGFSPSRRRPLGPSYEQKMPPLLTGKYWIKAVWDRTPPYEYDLYLYDGMEQWKASDAPAPAVRSGDYESRERPLFEIASGQTNSISLRLRPY